MENLVQLIANLDTRKSGSIGSILNDMGSDVTVQFFSHNGFSLEEQNVPKALLTSAYYTSGATTPLPLSQRDVEVVDNMNFRITVDVTEPQSIGLVTFASAPPAPRKRKRAARK